MVIKKLILVFITFGFLNAQADDGLKNMAVGIGLTAAVSIGIDVAMGKEFGATCSTVYGAWACPLAAMAVSQAITTTDKAGGIADFSADVGNGYDFDDSFGAENTNMGAGIDSNGSQFSSQLQQTQQELADKGYSVDPNTGKVKTPKGTFGAETFGSAQAMADAGLLGQDQVADVDKKIKKVQSDAYRVAKARWGGAGGGGGGGRSIASSSYDSGLGDMSGLFGMLNKKKKKGKAVKTAGLVKNLNGTPVGIRSDNIFKMINRRYQTHSQKRHFKE